jgi:tetratricopeptide (TPR) repeat protein
MDVQRARVTKEWGKTALLAAALVAAGLTARLWAPALAKLATDKKETIDGLKTLAELAGILLGAATVIWKWVRGRSDSQTPKLPISFTFQQATASAGAIQAGGNLQSGGIAAQGNLSAGGDVVGGDKTVTDQSKRAGHDYFDHPTIIHQPAAPPAPNALHSLPSPPADFTGRETELAELRAAIEQGGVHISGLQGQGGVGKTVLALKLAEEITPNYPSAQIYLDLRGVISGQAGERPLTPAEALAYVIRACHPDAKLPEHEAELRAIYLNLLHGKRALLLMDNARDAAQLSPLIPPPSCALLVTSRTHFTLPGLKSTDLQTLPPGDAEKLLLEIAERINGEAANIARLCGYLPLALRLAASTLAERQDLSPSDYARRLEKERLKVLAESEASIGVSYSLLDAGMQHRWRMLGVFPDSFDAAAALWNGVMLSAAPSSVILSEAKDAGIFDQTNTGILRRPLRRPPQNDTLDEMVRAAQDALGDLLKYSMLEWNAAARRYRLHDLMRDFACARLQEAGEDDEAARRHAMYYLNVLARQDDLYRKSEFSVDTGLVELDALFDTISAAISSVWVALFLFDVEWQNIQAGQAWTAANSESDNEAARLCSRYPSAGTYCLGVRLQPCEEIRWREAGLAAARRLKDRAGECQHLGNLGLICHGLGEYRRAIEYYGQSLAIALEIHDRQREGRVLFNASLTLDKLGERAKAIENAQAALKIFEQIEVPNAAKARKQLEEWKSRG